MGTLDFKPNVHPYVERTVFSLIAQSSLVVDIAYVAVWVSGLVFLKTTGISLKENMGQMVYGMDVDRERHKDQQIAFLPETSHDVLRRATTQLSGLQLAELKIFKGDLAGASDIANKVLADPSGDHAQAHYVLARVNLMQRQPGAAIGDFQEVLDTSKNPRTLAWSHIYLGRLYDIVPDREKAVAEYQAALLCENIGDEHGSLLTKW